MAAKLKQAKTIIVFQPRVANMLGRASVVEPALIAQPKMPKVLPLARIPCGQISVG